MKIYKYRKFDNYSYSELKENQLNGTIPSKLNDPLDCFIGFDFEYLLDEMNINKQFEDLFISYLSLRFIKRGFSECDKNELLIAFNESNFYLKKYFLECFIQYLINSIKESFFIFAFTDSPTNSMLWCNYANQFNGFVMEYESNYLANQFYENYLKNSEYDYLRKKIYVHEVRYSNVITEEQRISLEDFREMIRFLSIDDFETFDLKSNKPLIDFFMNRFYDSVFFSKSSEWINESEYRFVIPAFLCKKNLISNGHCTIEGFVPSKVFVPSNAKMDSLYSVVSEAENQNIPIATIDYMTQCNRQLKAEPLTDDILPLYLKFKKILDNKFRVMIGEV